MDSQENKKNKKKEKGGDGNKTGFFVGMLSQGGVPAVFGFGGAVLFGSFAFIPALQNMMHTAMTEQVASAISKWCLTMTISSGVVALFGFGSIAVNKFKPEWMPEALNNINRFIIPVEVLLLSSAGHFLASSFTSMYHVVNPLVEQVAAALFAASAVALAIYTYVSYGKDSKNVGPNEDPLIK